MDVFGRAGAATAGAEAAARWEGAAEGRGSGDSGEDRLVARAWSRQGSADVGTRASAGRLPTP